MVGKVLTLSESFGEEFFGSIVVGKEVFIEIGGIINRFDVVRKIFLE